MNYRLKKLPKKVKIGGVQYSVRVVDDWEHSDGADGETFCTVDQGNTIYIRSDLSPEARIITLIHEALHNMNSTMNHEFLDSLAEQLYQFLSDNKLMTKEFTELDPRRVAKILKKDKIDSTTIRELDKKPFRQRSKRNKHIKEPSPKGS